MILEKAVVIEFIFGYLKRKTLFIYFLFIPSLEEEKQVQTLLMKSKKK